MKFGISTLTTDEGIRPVPLGRALEERSFDSLFVAEHAHVPVDRRTPCPGGGELPRMYYRTLGPFVALSAIAATTERVLLGTGIALVPQRDPITRTGPALPSDDGRAGDGEVPGPTGRGRRPVPLSRARGPSRPPQAPAEKDPEPRCRP
ncbi:hypothetical protein GCM10012280_34450 [Wenjunlia tyrosinilytica]|uniref:Luciferase-like domain-containing protein n=1 Tax=Wenjunlia tyrosinilytica TaxID=1544741 RepID=A0A917ZS78_9ACTN|nr:hypothetical protein GCM10012280_34450 [Wenjunlia tyrosinilytica]